MRSLYTATVVCIFTIGMIFMSNVGAVPPVVNESSKLVASDGEERDFFGISVAAADEDTILVGAYFEENNGHDTGSVYVFTRSNGIWTEHQKLIPGDMRDDAEFGMSMAVDGDTAIIGAWQDSEKGIFAGAAYIFTRTNGVWTEQQKLTASDAVGWVHFGAAVALDGDTAVIGSFGDDTNGNASGAAYVFTRSNGIWTEHQKITASDGAASDFFGSSVAVNGDTAVIGAKRDDDNGEVSGSVYVFTLNNNVWSQRQKLTANDGASYDWFGTSVTIDADTIMVGATGDDDSGESSGSVYVFTKNNHNVWAEQQKLTASDGTHHTHFGQSIYVTGDHAVIGAPGFSRGGYVFTRSGGVWSETLKLRGSDTAGNGNLGGRVSASGTTVVLSNSADDIVAAIDAGSAYVFNVTMAAPPAAEECDNLSKCCFYEKDSKEKYICTTDKACPDMVGWTRISQWGTEKCDQCSSSRYTVIPPPDPDSKPIDFQKVEAVAKWILENWDRIFPDNPLGPHLQGNDRIKGYIEEISGP